MIIVSINGIEYSIEISVGKLEVQFFNIETGLEKVFVFHQKEIELVNKRVFDKFYSYDITPTGQRINRQEHTQTTSEEDFDFFELSMLGTLLKRFTVNGLFKNILGLTNGIFDSNGVLIEEQPVPIPQPDPEQ
jgi:hypothetical protein